MQNYELTLLVSSEVAEEEINKVTEKISSFLREENGVITQAEKPIQKTLAYPINKQREAYLVILSFYLEPEKIKDINQKLKGVNKVLRFTILAKKPERKVSPKRQKKVAAKEGGAATKEAASSFETLKEKEGQRQDEKLREIEEKLDEILRE